MIGFKITQPDDPLTKTTAEHIFRQIKNPDQKILQTIEHLRNLKTIDEKSYKNFKKNLPYFVCGNFHPPFRKKENFASILYFIADFDNLHSSSLIPDTLKNKMAVDNRVVAAFVSPGSDGLKVVFKFSEPCKDAGAYKLIYSNFLHHFAAEYQLLQHLDKVTHDVTRATFLSYDPHILINPNPVAIDPQPFLSIHTGPFFLPTNNNKQPQQENYPEVIPEKTPASADPDEQTLSYIKNLLRDKKNSPPEKIITPSENVKNIIPKLEQFLIEIQCKLTTRKTIHYGEQITITNGKSVMEFNIFYGKKGYNVVVNPRSGTNHALAAEFKNLIYQAIITLSASPS